MIMMKKKEQVSEWLVCIFGILIGVTNGPKHPSEVVSTSKIKGFAELVSALPKGKIVSWKTTFLEMKIFMVVKSSTLYVMSQSKWEKKIKRKRVRFFLVSHVPTPPIPNHTSCKISPSLPLWPAIPFVPILISFFSFYTTLLSHNSLTLQQVPLLTSSTTIFLARSPENSMGKW